MTPRFYRPLRPFHDPDLCGGTLGFTEDLVRNVYNLYCSCGFMGEVTLEEILRATPYVPCHVCGTRTPQSLCPECSRVERELGVIVTVLHHALVVR